MTDLRAIQPISIDDLDTAKPETGEPICERVDPKTLFVDPLRICLIEGCGRPAKSRGWCNKHLMRFRRHGHPLGGGRNRPKKGEIARFLTATMATTHDECVLWPFSTNSAGYGQVRIDGESLLVHRYVCERVNGSPPAANSQAAHSCGNGHLGCMSPRHLTWKSPLDNVRDQVVHGTKISGTRVGSAKLDEAAVLEIRTRFRAGEKQKVLASEFGLAQSSISLIVTGKNWGWLDEHTAKVAA